MNVGKTELFNKRIMLTWLSKTLLGYDLKLGHVEFLCGSAHKSQECNNSDKMKPYYHRKDELIVYQGCLTWENRVIIPDILREKVKTELHSGHIGIVRMKAD